MSIEELAAVADELPDSLKQFAEESEEQQAEPPPEKVAEEVAEEKPADPLVEKANKIGWVGKDEWVAAGKDPDEWVDHAEYVRRKPLFDKIHTLSKALKDKDEKIEAVSKYAQKAAEIAREKAIKEFEEERRKAVEVGDIEAFEAADKQLQEARKEPVVEESPAAPEIPPVIQEFAKRNDKWFEKDKAMTIFMVETTKEYTAAGMTLEKAMERAESDVKKEFAHKFENPNKGKPSPVAANNAEARPKTVTYASLKDEHKQVWSVLKSKMTFEKFVEGLRAQGEYQ